MDNCMNINGNIVNFEFWEIFVSRDLHLSHRTHLSSPITTHHPIMTSVRKRKMNRSLVKKSTRRLKDKHRDINIQSNAYIAAHWDKKLTMAQNYKKLGLRVKIGVAAGGTEQPLETWREQKERLEAEKQEMILPEHVEQTEDPSKIPLGEARIIRDDEGKVVKVIHGTMSKEQQKATKEDLEVIKHLIELGAMHAANKKDRHMSPREMEFLEVLDKKHGDDYEAMKWDMKLNPMQQLAGDLRKRIALWKKLREADKE